VIVAQTTTTTKQESAAVRNNKVFELHSIILMSLPPPLLKRPLHAVGLSVSVSVSKVTQKVMCDANLHEI